ncbi:hypothetical protein Tco_1306290 [Tanacetum coccineum]
MQRLCTSENKGQPFVLVGSTNILFCLFSRLRFGRASLWIGDSLTVALSGLYSNEHFEVLCAASEARPRAVRWGTPSRPQVRCFAFLCIFFFSLPCLKETWQLLLALYLKVILWILSKNTVLLYAMILSSEHTALDAPDGYIPLYLSLFSIGDLRFPLNAFYLDVFEYFECHFPLFNPFGVARVTTFAVASKAYGGEPTLTLFRYFLALGPAGDWLPSIKGPVLAFLQSLIIL